MNKLFLDRIDVLKEDVQARESGRVSHIDLQRKVLEVRNKLQDLAMSKECSQGGSRDLKKLIARLIKCERQMEKRQIDFQNLVLREQTVKSTVEFEIQRLNVRKKLLQKGSDLMEELIDLMESAKN